MQRFRLKSIPTWRGRQLLRALIAHGLQPSPVEAQPEVPGLAQAAEPATAAHPLRAPHFALSPSRARAGRVIVGSIVGTPQVD